MAECILRDGTVLSDFGKPYVVAEVNTSHNGNVETAKEMIQRARDSGCNCVKFQSWSPESLYSQTYYKENPIAKRIVRKFAFSEDELMEVAKHCRECGIAFSSTPYSKNEVDYLLEYCDAPYVKIASMDCNNYPFIDYIARTGAPIILSTGMSDMEEIKKSVSIIEDSGNTNLCILHCISMYPPKISTIRLNNILGLRDEFPDYPIGLSDHSVGTEITVASVAMGVAMIEKHFTLDKTKIGMDNQMAAEPEEMAQLVCSCENVYVAMGERERVVFVDEIEQRKKMRRSIVSTRDLKAGSLLSEKDLDLKRPGTGLAPDKIKDLLGRTLRRDVQYDTLIVEEDISR